MGIVGNIGCPMALLKNLAPFMHCVFFPVTDAVELWTKKKIEDFFDVCTLYVYRFCLWDWGFIN